MGTITIKIEGGLTAGGGGLGILSSIEGTLKRIEGLLDNQSKLAVRGLQTNQATQNILNQQFVTQNRTLNVLQATSNIQNNISNVTNNIVVQSARVEANFHGWRRELDATSKLVRSISASMSSFNATGGIGSRFGLGGAGQAIRSAASQSFGGLFDGEGLGGIVGGITRIPFGVAEFGLKLGGSLASSLSSGFTKTIGAIGGVLSSSVYGAVLGIPLQLGGGLLGAAGELSGSLLGAAGGLIGKVGELGGAIAEKLVNSISGALSKGLSVGLVAAGAVGTAAISSAIAREPVQAAFETKTAGLGGSKEVLADLQAATRGTVAATQLMTTANRALQYEAVRSRADLVALAQGARVLGKAVGIDTPEAFDRLARGIGKLEPELLDELGITVRATDAYRAWGAAIGKSTDELTESDKKAAFAAVVYGKLAEKTAQLGEGTETSGERFGRMKANIGDLTATLGAALLPAFNRTIDTMDMYILKATKWVDLHKQEIGEYAVAAVNKLGSALKTAWEWASKFYENVQRRGIFGAIKDELDATKDTWDPWIKVGKAKIDEFLVWIEDRAGDIGLKLSSKILGSVESDLATALFGDDQSLFGLIPIGQAAKDREENKFRTRRAATYKGSIGAGVLPAPADYINDGDSYFTTGFNVVSDFIAPRRRYGRSFHGGLPDEAGALATSRPSQDPTDFDRLRSLQNRIAHQEAGGSQPTLTSEESAFLLSMRRVVDAAEDHAKELTRVTKKLAGDIDDENDRIKSLLSRRADIDDRKYGIELASLQKTMEINAALESAKADIASQKSRRIAGAPGEVARGIASDIDLPGVSLRARNQFRAVERLERRERVRDINSAFQSRGPQDVFGNVNTGGGLFGTGFGNRADSTPFGIARQDTAASARAALLEQVKATNAYIEQIAQIERQAFEDLQKADSERNAAIDELTRETTRQLNSLTKSTESNTKAIRDAIKELAELKRQQAANDRQQAELAQQLRSLK